MADELTAALSVLPEATVLVFADGVVHHANPAARRVLGLADGANRLADLVADPEELERALHRWRGSRQLLPASLSIRRDGELHRLRCDGGVVRVQKGDQPGLLLVRIRDRNETTSRFRELTTRIDALTEEVVRRTRAEELAAAQREWLEVTLSSIGDGVIATDADGRVTLMNPAAARYTGWEAERAMGRPLREVFVIVNEETRAPVEHPVERVLREGVVVGLANHTILVRPDGSELAIADSAAPIRDARGVLMGVVLVFQDETTRRFNERTRKELLGREHEARERAEESVRAKDELIATVSHELRTPLNAILGWAEALHDDGVDESELERGLEVIVRNARMQSRLIEDLLDLSKVVTGALELQVTSIDLAKVARAAIDSITPAAQAKRVELVERGLERPLPMVGDAGRLQQALWNLLSNAVKFSERDGRVEIDVSRAGSRAQVVVRDGGAGLSAEQLEHLFEPFWQARRRHAGPDRGLGLGLSIALRIVEGLGGRVFADSLGPGQGATFTIELPVRALGASERPLAPDALTVEVARRGAVRPLDGTRVLVVEDEADSRELLTMLLENRGAVVRAAESAGAALSIFDEWIPDVLVSDIAMPGTDGYELIRAIRRRPAALGGEVPAGALTAFAAAADRRRAEEAGFQRHLAKPATPAQVVELVRELAALPRPGDAG